MSVISASELDLLTFFEVEPTFLDPNDPWPYTDAVYEVKRGELGLSFAVAPAYQDVRIVLKMDEAIVYELNAMAVLDVRYCDTGGRESLEVLISESDILVLRLKPVISLSHAVTAGT